MGVGPNSYPAAHPSVRPKSGRPDGQQTHLEKSKVPSSYEKGIAAEKRVCEYFLRRGFILRHHRLRTPFAEVDLCLYCSRRRKILLVEVKLCDHAEYRQYLITKRQRQRLLRATQWMSEQVSDKGLDVQLLLAIVSHTGQIQLFSDALVDHF